MATVVNGSFEWNTDKAAANERKHGVTFVQAASAILDPLSLELADALDESRIITIGRSDNGVLYVVSTDRGTRIRIISARKATPHEQRTYEETDR